MNIQSTKIELVKMVLETDNPSILASIKSLFKKSSTVDFWETLSQEQKDDILHGVSDIEDGKVVNYDNFMKKHR